MSKRSEAEERIRRELRENERVLWLGYPGKGLRFASTDWFAVPFSLLWAGFAVLWEAMAVKAGAPWFFTLFGVPFVLVGVHMVVGRFFFDAFKRSKTAYCVTDSRALIVTWLASEQARSINLGALSEVRLVRHKDQTGTIVFGSVMQATRSVPQSPRFEWLEDFETVHRLITKIQTEHSEHD